MFFKKFILHCGHTDDPNGIFKKKNIFVAIFKKNPCKLFLKFVLPYMICMRFFFKKNINKK